MSDIDDDLHLVKKNILKARLPALFFLLQILFLCLTGCHTSKKEVLHNSKFALSQDERTSLREFFRDLLFKNSGAYTLFGTKPISLSHIYHFSEEDKRKIQEYFDSLSEEAKSKTRKRRYNFDVNYQKWEIIKPRFEMSQYLFGIFPIPSNPLVEVIVFVNIEETLRILIKYYEDFRRVIGTEFDPVKVVFEIEDRNSLFWNKALNHAASLGILLGYGRDNAWFFEWTAEYHKEKNQLGAFFSSLPSRYSEDDDIVNYDAQNFLLPIYVTYGLYADTQLIEKYKKEREQIKVLYKGRDEVDVALERLMR